MTYLTKKNKFSTPRKFITPDGDVNGDNLDYTIPNGEEFWPGTLEVFIDQGSVCPATFNEVGTTGFEINVDPSDPNARNKPIRDSETLWVNYYKKPKCK